MEFFVGIGIAAAFVLISIAVKCLCKSLGAVMPCDFVICNEAPDDDAVAACKALGAALV